MFAKQGGKFVADNFHDLLVRRELQHDFAADGFAADVGEELIGHGDVDIAFEESFADFSESGVQMLFGQLALAAEILECALELFG
jgi:hypothetical protein